MSQIRYLLFPSTMVSQGLSFPVCNLGTRLNLLGYLQGLGRENEENLSQPTLIEGMVPARPVVLLALWRKVVFPTWPALGEKALPTRFSWRAL